jgi:predicted dehydrogenase
MRSLKTFPEIKVVRVFDTNADRLAAFCAFWKVTPAHSLEEMTRDDAGGPQIILNLTNPRAHYEVSKACLLANKHVYSEKPLAMNMGDAQTLCELAEKNGLLLSSAPCSLLGEAAQTLWLAVRRNTIGKVRLVYAELDDDFLPQAPYRSWTSASGAPWPYDDEFSVGCTLEHAGYYLTWLMAMFGTVQRVVAASSSILLRQLDGHQEAAPDYSCATLFFKSGVVARLTCSVIAPHNHQIRIIGDNGVLELDQSWNNDAPVRVRRRFSLRRRLVNSPIARRIKISHPTHPKVKRWGAAALNFALGPAEMFSALKEKRPSRLSAKFALHLNEVTLAIQNANGVQIMKTECPDIQPMPWAN